MSETEQLTVLMERWKITLGQIASRTSLDRRTVKNFLERGASRSQAISQSIVQAVQDIALERSKSSEITARMVAAG